MSFTSYSNISTITKSCTTNSGQVPCTVGLYPAAVGVWGTAVTSGNGTEGIPTIATTRFYLDPDTNATVSSSVICNWEQYSSAYVVPGRNASQAGYYTVNSDCALIGVLRRDQEWYWRYPAISATYPNPKLDLGSKFETWYNTCPTTTGLPIQTTTSSIIYSDTWSQKVPMPFYSMPELSNYLPDVPEVSSCSIYLYGSPQTLKPANHLTENRVLARTTTAAQPADTPQPEAPQTTQPNDEPETTITATVPVLPTQPTDEAASPQRPTQDIPSPTANPGSPTDDVAEESAPEQDEDADPTPINQDPIWSIIGEAAEQASQAAPSSPTQADSPGPSEDADQSDDNPAVPIVIQPQDSSNESANSGDADETNDSGEGDDEAISTGGQNNADSGNGSDTDSTTNEGTSSSAGGTESVNDSEPNGDSTPTSGTTESGSSLEDNADSGQSSGTISSADSDSQSDEGGPSGAAGNASSGSDDENAGQGIVLGTIPSQTDASIHVTETSDENPESDSALSQPQGGTSNPTPAAALTFAGPEATPAVTLLPVEGSSEDEIESIVAAGGASYVDGAVVIGSQTIRPGGPAVTLSADGTSPVVSIPAQRQGREFMITITGASASQVLTLSAGDGIAASQIRSLISQEDLQATDSAIVVGSRTLVPGGNAVTINEHDATYIASLPTPATPGAPPGVIAISKLDTTMSEDLNGYICSVIGGCASQTPNAEESSRAIASLSTVTDQSSRLSSTATARSTTSTGLFSTAASASINEDAAASTGASESSASRAQSSLQSVLGAVLPGAVLSLLTYFL
ncbi:hypothetical protein CLAFUW4_07617 [Fulvia fulva]|uniref:Uncharacterized protein n=1 Tax=Passalora fulva TaxID=5499 RepID=A0A9Q8PB42_PASFU|nr:uncharacterized protein CLAFUR5_07747 [Fulvia fulva]UJO19172.1 hypothetical protein CLAFUR5_07747 [Fulvia fulva]WPV15984.1 hypothetical protein CLAFUW4_07617 [Fulvia fulva]WPV30630.1 hypothetical protein CLAFUW7_07618 [Fulvia fulva]